ncbi:GNAT family N-acetyltransferase [Devosia chinhatensis]|uniref:N-acetyltransferase domain-containing protein n=1 Tax=Devosia chinhatensis TaxID=429727 RepID=A0A0F5FK82_9HYPH|nr:GNAT family N-acetyltransferase [Devosia chinhatensis]KKB08985.1 hypothetical protein VE26_02780 [Devosia chinhatensis]
MVPVLDTERLVLRGHQTDDHAACSALWGHPDVTRYIGGRPSTPEEVWSRILRYSGHWQLLGFGYFAVIEKQSGQLIGEAGLADFRRDLDPGLDVPEAGWVFDPAWQGRGLAQEAMKAVLAWAAAKAMDRSACLIDPENAPSLALAARLGFGSTEKRACHGRTSLVLWRDGSVRGP